MKRLKAVVENAQRKLADAITSFVEASADDNKDDVHLAVLAKMERTIELLKSAIETGTRWLAENKAGKKPFKSFSSHAKDTWM